MNQHLQNILNTIQQDKNLSEDEKASILRSLKDADKEFEIATFKLDRTEKVKRTTAILLEETIEELEQKRKAVEEQNKELEIETALERVRTVAMAMRKANDLLDICKIVYDELGSLKFSELRNAMINIHHDDKGSLLNYDYSEIVGRTVTNIPYDFHPLVEKQVLVTKNAQDAFFEFSFTGEELKQFRELRKSNGEQDDPKLEITDALYYYFFSIGTGSIGISTYSPINEEKLKLLKRFRNVFNLSYQRYTDITLAEAQAREAQIEVAVERVRAQSMAMHQTADLDKVNKELYNQLQWLKVDGLSGVSMYFIDEQGEVTVWDLSSPGNIGNPNSYAFKFSSKKYPILGELWQHYKISGDYFTLDYPLEKLKAAIPEFKEINNIIANAVEEAINSGDLKHQWNAFGRISNGVLGIDLMAPPSEDTKTIILKMAGAFNLAYKRFLDLQKAEAQTREAQIEAALEKVRSRSLAMHKSDEIGEVVWIIVDKMKELNIDAQGISVATFIPGTKDLLHWHANAEMVGAASTMMMPYFDDLIFNDCIIARDTGLELLVKQYSKEEKDNYIKAAIEHTDFKYFPEDLQQWILEQPFLNFSFAIQKHSGIFLEDYTGKTFLKEENDILIRFAKVFEQAYVRFLDLQKAEAQAREAQIEAALERVRSRSLAMQKSEELKEVIQVVYEQFVHLNVNTEHTGFVIDYKERDDRLIWVASKYGVPSQLTIPYFDCEYYNSFNEAKEKGWDFFATNLSFEDKNSFYRELFKYIPGLAEDAKDFYFNCQGLAISTVLLEDVSLYIENFEGIPYSDEDNATLMRFGKVFQQTYTRFLDLQKAEAQAREAQIEASLEKVRSSSLSMHHSEELKEVVKVVFANLRALGIKKMDALNINILHEGSKEFDLWIAAPGQDYTTNFHLPYFDHPIANDFFQAVEKGEVLHQKLYDYQEKNKYFEYMFENSDNKYLPEERKKLILQGAAYSVSAALAKHSSIFIHNYGGDVFTGEDNEILIRFSKVFDQAYTRFLDLQKAEAQAKESQIEAALERVRSRTLAMQRSVELADTAAVLFKQLILLGIQPNRLYIAIIKDETGNTEFWITDEDGSKVSSAFETNLNDNLTFRKMLDGWKAEKKSLIIDMQGDELQEYFTYLRRITVPFKGGITQKRRIQHVAYFGKGFIGMACPDDQPGESMVLLERFAAAFNLTFTRFNDLKLAEVHAVQAADDLIKLQTEKKRAEDALTELQATQKQLVQSEKMASLGELTAGIAHEIQNPLNFVNNFSEVSNELIDEMMEEVAKGNYEEAKAIADDVKQNLEKINHHGKRADGIVKGMLQHSRSTSAIKEPTDINKLADEYFRLAYHGLRAKDKSFNATLKTDYDESIGNISIIPQDIGRVILNLITNAFYVVDEKSKQKIPGYVPTVSVSTKHSLREGRGEVQIMVTDNGNGIPSSIKDKIFQPFFTTKPTGQGTGLGLSLAYDIVKAHGGELKMETKEEEEQPALNGGQPGTKFIIQIPIT